MTNEIESLTEKIPSFRLWRAFIIFRAFKIFKGFQFFEIITYVVRRSFYSFFSITALIFSFLLVFSLVGLQLFNNLLNDEVFKTSAKSFNSQFESFMTVFNIMTLDNYSDIFYSSWNKTNNFYLTVFFILLVFIVNMFLLNLFITILLDGFDKIAQEQTEEFKKKNTFSLQSVYDEEDFNNFSNGNSFVSDSNIKKKQSSYKKSLSLSAVNEDKTTKDITSKGITINEEELDKVEEETSLFLFSKINIIRIISIKLLKNRFFNLMINLTLTFSVAYMAFLTFVDYIDNEIDFWVKITINSILIFESIVLIIKNGFIMSKNSYIRSFFNIVDSIVIIVFILDIFTSAPDSINVLF